MNITGLTLNEVGEIMKQYLPPYLQKDFQFQESYQLEFSEIKHNIPVKYHKSFNDSDILNVASGGIESEDFEYDYNIILVSDSEYAEALFLILQKTHKISEEIETELIKSFLLAEINKIKSNLTIEQLSRYNNILAEVIRMIEKDMDKLMSKSVEQKFKKRLLELIRETMVILEEFY